MCCYLTVISETGVPHNSLLLEIDGKKHWLGFGPAEGWSFNIFTMTFRTAGRVSKGSREKDINNYVRFRVPCDKARKVLSDVVPKWKGATYFMSVQDCVSFARDVAETCGLSTNSVDITPYGFLLSLAFANTYTHYNTQPYPWNTPGPTTVVPITPVPPLPIPSIGAPIAPLPDFNPPM